MNWYAGNIAEAVAEAKSKDAIFVVYIEGDDEMSAKLHRFIDETEVRNKLETNDFVAIKIQGDSQAYGQFISVYKVVPVPSIFFIGKAGAPLEIATGVTASVEELSTKIDRALVTAGKLADPEVTSILSESNEAMSLTSNTEQEWRSTAGADSSDSEDEQKIKSTAAAGKTSGTAASVDKRESAVVVEGQAAAAPTMALVIDKPAVAVATAVALDQPTVAVSNADVVDNPAVAAPVATVSTAAATVKSALSKANAVVVEKQPAAVSALASAIDKPAGSVATATVLDKAAMPASGPAAASTVAFKSATSIVSSAEPVETATALEKPTAPVTNSSSSAAAAAAEKRATLAGETATSAPKPEQSSSARSATTAEPASISSAPTQPLSDSEARMVEVQNVLEEKKRERQLEEQRRQKDSELRRRREGRDAQSVQTWQREQEMREVQERIRRDRQEEQVVRDRIRSQIAADRAEQAHRDQHTAELVSLNNTSAEEPESSILSVDETRLQIRLPGGIHRTKAFPAAERLAAVRTYVQQELLVGSNIREFYLATSYPRREFKAEDELKTLYDLNLVPNAVVLVLTREQTNRVMGTGGSFFNMLTTVMWAMLTPAAKAFDYINKMGLQRVTQRFAQMMGWNKPRPNIVMMPRDPAGGRNLDLFVTVRAQQPQEPPEAAAVPPAEPTQRPASPRSNQRGSAHMQAQPAAQAAPQQQTQQSQFQQRPGGYQAPRYGESNIRRLQDTKGVDDDQATYNGNSTQQQ